MNWPKKSLLWQRVSKFFVLPKKVLVDKEDLPVKKTKKFNPWNFISRYEKLILAILSVIIVISGTIWYNQFAKLHTGTPSNGGTYIEGVVGNKDEAQAIAAKITKTGLFGFDQKGNLTNQLVDSWSSNSDKTEYHFILKDGVDPNEIVTTLTQESSLLGQAIATNDGRDVDIKLAQASPDLPLVLTQPIFDFGPFKISFMNDQEIILVKNTRPLSVHPYLNKVIIRTFSSEDDLKNAINHNQIDGATLSDTSFSNKKFKLEKSSLPQYYALILNVNRDPFRSQSYRQAVTTEQGSLSTPFTLTVTNKEPDLTLATALVTKWKNNGLTVTLNPMSEQDIESKTIPTRDFQAIVAGISYNASLDPYYIWQSSQIRPPGNNISGLKDSGVDELINRIEQTTSLTDRQNLINQLNQTITNNGTAVFLEQDSFTTLITKDITYVPPVLALSNLDKWQMIQYWWAK